jgi:ribosome-binding factor A
MGSEQQQRDCLQALKKASGYIQRELAKELQSRYTPTIQILLDKGVKNSLEVARILQAEGSTAAAVDDFEGTIHEEVHGEHENDAT